MSISCTTNPKLDVSRKNNREKFKRVARKNASLVLNYCVTEDDDEDLTSDFDYDSIRSTFNFTKGEYFYD